MHRYLLLIAALCFALGGNALAFHDAGVAHCNGCHTMHNSENGAWVDTDSPDGNAWLLKDETPSDVCLSCHSTGSRGVFAADPLAPNGLNGGGDFVFLTEDNLNDGHSGASHPIVGDAAGHNIDAPSKGVSADATLLAAPGGTFPSTALGCSSCHDPHGNDGFRFLNTVGTIQDGLYTFTSATPDAEGIDARNTDELDDNHTAYKSGMSEWCGNCHGDFHDNSTKLIHPSGSTLGGDVATAYGLYNGTEDIIGGNPLTSYLAAVPFEDANAAVASTDGPDAGSKVMCLTCHRAHASSAPNAGRWDFNVTLLEEDGVESGSLAIEDPYASPNQRSLCNKCHVKDAGDHIEIAAP
ncbi:MAG: hypothetical protein ABIE07_01365 [Candidatus Zixiibacteriota bacterium]